MALTMLQKLRTDARLTLESVAADVELSTSQVHRFEKGEREPRLSELQRLARRFGVTVAELIGEQSPRDVPLIDWETISIKDVGSPVKLQYIEKHVFVAELPLGDWIALHIVDDSMDRIAPVSSIIIVDRSDTELVDGKYYIVKDSSTVEFRRFRSSPDRLRPYSTNPEYETKYLDRSHAVIGRVRKVKTDLP